MRYNSGEYFQTVLVHEFVTAWLYHYPRTSQFRGWFIQGLEQYEGLTATNRSDLWGRVAGRVFRDATVSCGGGPGAVQQIAMTEVYWSGALLQQFLAHRFGEAIHIRMLNSPRATVPEALLDELPEGVTPCGLFDELRNWMYEEHGVGNPVPVPALSFLPGGTGRGGRSSRPAVGSAVCTP